MKSCACPEFIARLAPERAPTSVPEFIFLKGWQPRVAIEEYINGEWIVIGDNPAVELMDMNDRTVFCVDQGCASSARPVQTRTGKRFTSKTFSYYFKVIGECECAAYQMACIVDPPLLRKEVYLSQMITGDVFGYGNIGLLKRRQTVSINTTCGLFAVLAALNSIHLRCKRSIWELNSFGLGTEPRSMFMCGERLSE